MNEHINTSIDKYKISFQEKNVSNLVDRNIKKGFQSFENALFLQLLRLFSKQTNYYVSINLTVYTGRRESNLVI